MTQEPINVLSCYHCDYEFDLSELTKVDNNYYCEECLNENFTACTECDDLTHNDNLNFDESGNAYCNDCFSEKVIICHHCEEAIHIDDSKQDYNDNYYCSDCFRNYTTKCDWCGEYHHNDDIHSNQHSQDLCESCWENASCCENCGEWLPDDETYYYNDVSYCQSCYDDIDKNIHESDYTPDLIFYDDPENPSYDHLGVELEIDCGGKYDHNAETLLDIMNFQTEDKIWIKEDGSIYNGFEIVSHPATLTSHLELFDWEELMKEAVNLGYESHNANTCGLHVHINRQAFGLTEIEQDLNITKLLLITETNWENFIRFSRRTNEQLNKWAKSYGLTDKMDKDATTEDILDTAKTLNDNSRYYAINLQNTHTVELRLFRGTLNYNTFVATLQFCQLLLNISKKTNIKDLHKLTWDFIVDAAKSYEELTEYLEIRELA